MYIVYHPSFMSHRHWPGHPERPERLSAVKSGLEAAGLWREPVDIEPAPLELLESIHSPVYMEGLRAREPGSLDPDTFWHDDTYDIAMRAMGGAYTASRRTLDTGEPGLCLLRPPGHHAGPDYFMGFCYFNNAALAVETALRHGAKRVAVVDVDVHHGNGTNDIFASRRDVLYTSTHQWGIFPGTGHYTDRGRGDGEGYNINIPLRARSGDSTYRMAFDSILQPALEEYKPGMMVVSMGADTHYMDPLAGLTLSTPAHLEMYRRLVDMSKKLCGGRILFVLEGGYDLGALADIMTGLAAILGGEEPPEPQFTRIRDPDGEGIPDVQEALAAHREQWGL